MIINGKQMAQEHMARLAHAFSVGPNKRTLHIVTVGQNAVTDQFIAIKKVYAKKVDVITQVYYKETSCTQATLEKDIEDIVDRALVGDAIIIQLPLPEHIDKQKVLNKVPAHYDIDVLNQEHYKAFCQGTTRIIPPVAAAIMHILTTYSLLRKGMRIVIVGSGRLVGMPVAKVLEQLGYSYAIINAATQSEERKKLLLQADLIITGAGDPWFLRPEDISEGVILIDAGTSESENTTKGDIHPDCYVHASFYTPVPGGVGPLTVAMLFDNMNKLIAE